MTYKDAITAAMTRMGKDERVCFIGYNVRYGKAAGTLNGIAESQLIEMPLAENLMMGAAIGLSLAGRIPIVYFERMDFAPCALDALVNHLDKLRQLSDGLHNPACIIRCVVGNSLTPLYTGKTHTQNLASSMRELLTFPVLEASSDSDIAQNYAAAYESAKDGKSTMVIDFKDLWSK